MGVFHANSTDDAMACAARSLTLTMLGNWDLVVHEDWISSICACYLRIKKKSYTFFFLKLSLVFGLIRDTPHNFYFRDEFSVQVARRATRFYKMLSTPRWRMARRVALCKPLSSQMFLDTSDILVNITTTPTEQGLLLPTRFNLNTSMDK